MDPAATNLSPSPTHLVVFIHCRSSSLWSRLHVVVIVHHCRLVVVIIHHPQRIYQLPHPMLWLSTQHCHQIIRGTTIQTAAINEDDGWLFELRFCRRPSFISSVFKWGNDFNGSQAHCCWELHAVTMILKAVTGWWPSNQSCGNVMLSETKFDWVCECCAEQAHLFSDWNGNNFTYFLS